MREFKEIFGIYGKHNNLISCYEGIVRANTTSSARKLALEDKKMLENETYRKVKLLSLRPIFIEHKQEILPF